MSKEEIDPKFLSNPFMVSELFAIVSSDRIRAVCNRQEQFDHRIAYQICCAPFDLAQQGQARFSFRKGYDGLVMPFTNDGESVE